MKGADRKSWVPADADIRILRFDLWHTPLVRIVEIMCLRNNSRIAELLVEMCSKLDLWDFPSNYRSADNPH